jgi:hypothetical protein
MNDIMKLQPPTGERELINTLRLEFRYKLNLSDEECLKLALVAVGPIKSYVDWVEAKMDLEVEKAMTTIAGTITYEGEW